jgi:transcriptional regulator with XRE-family HTH domain
MVVILHGEQIRAARGLIGWSQGHLARQAGLGEMTVKRFEATTGPVSGKIESLVKIQDALEKAGIIFQAADHEFGVGVRLAKPRQT